MNQEAGSKENNFAHHPDLFTQEQSIKSVEDKKWNMKCYWVDTNCNQIMDTPKNTTSTPIFVNRTRREKPQQTPQKRKRSKKRSNCCYIIMNRRYISLISHSEVADDNDGPWQNLVSSPQKNKVFIVILVDRAIKVSDDKIIIRCETWSVESMMTEDFSLSFFLCSRQILSWSSENFFTKTLRNVYRLLMRQSLWFFNCRSFSFS